MEKQRKLRVAAKRALLVLCDASCVFLSFFCTLLFRFGGRIEPQYIDAFYIMILPLLAMYLICFAAFHLYSSLWEHASVEELIQTVCAVAVGCACSMGLSILTGNRLPISVYIAASLVLILLVGWSRMCYRIARRIFNAPWLPGVNQRKALIVGAGQTGSTIIRQMMENKGVGQAPVAVVDDDPDKQGMRIHGVRVLGACQDIPRLAKQKDIAEIIYCIPSATAQRRKEILEICTRTRCDLKIIPGIEAMLEGVQLGKLRDVDIGDLLEREEVKLDMKSISGYLTGATILVTGGGGSIGSEICRQVAPFKPKKLVVFDIYENNAYELFMDLKRQYGGALDIDVVIGSVRDIPRLDEVFGRYRPDVVFHAAAHKHVPLMEVSPMEAVKNNVFGTFNVAKAADICGARRFVLISTDKAVNPANIMGATKYLCELVIQYMNYKSRRTQYVAVRFGNVLGSNGSVIPLFRRQIAAGGPVTVTHKDMMRYFMTIPEAARLVIQAGSMAEEGQIFILDMGEPVSIDKFARDFIRLSGYEPDVDIKIVYTGLRPGEKMYEELLQDGEDVIPASFKGILVGKTYPMQPEEIKEKLDWLRQSVEADPIRTPEYIRSIVPTYQAVAPEDAPQASSRGREAVQPTRSVEG